MFTSVMFLRLLACLNCFSNPYNFPAQWSFKIVECVCLVAVSVFTILYRYDVGGMDFADAVMKTNLLAIATSIGYVFFRMMPMMGAIIARCCCFCFALDMVGGGAGRCCYLCGLAISRCFCECKKVITDGD